MAQLFLGKLLPNLNIAIESEADDAIEEGELSEDDDITEDLVSNAEPPKKDVDIVRGWMQTLHAPKIYENKNGGFVTGIDLSSEVLMKKLEDRAERFGLQKKDEALAPITQVEIDALYKSLEIDPANLNSCKLKNIRLDALHMRGVDEMSTNEIFKYFGKYGPASVEWINDSSCNVVWLDEATTARALLGSSQPLKIKKKNASIPNETDSPSESLDQFKSPLVRSNLEKTDNEAVIEMSDSEKEDDDDDSRKYRNSKSEASMDFDTLASEGVIDEASIDIPVPPGHWRVGEPHPKAKALLLRFATKDDKKIRGAEKRSHYYKKYGNPNYGGLKGLISQSRKRKMQSAKNRQAVDQFNDELSDHNDAKTSGELFNRPIAKAIRTKEPKMKMYADEEEVKAKSGGLRKIHQQPKSGNIHSRLGTKYTRDDLIHLGSKFSSDSEEEEEDNIEINCTVPSKFNIWTDLAKSMAKEDRVRPQDDDSSDLESELDSYRNLRAQDSRNVNKKSADLDVGDLRSKVSRNFRRSEELEKELDSYGDLRSRVSRYSNKSADLDEELDSYRDLRSKVSRNSKRSSDLEEELDSYRDLRSKVSGNLKRSGGGSESELDSYRRLDSRRPRDFKRSGDSRTRSSRSSRNRLDKEDLRSTLKSMSRRRDTSREGSRRRRSDERSSARKKDFSREDLRSKLKRLKREDSEPRKFRSPLLIDD